MDEPRPKLSLLAGGFAVCRLAPDAPLPEWGRDGAFCSITRTADELSVVCPQEAVPAGVQAEPGWSALKVAGPLDLALTGIAASITRALAAAAIPVIVIATYETDYVLVKEERLEATVEALAQAGHAVEL